MGWSLGDPGASGETLFGDDGRVTPLGDHVLREVGTWYRDE